MLNKHVLHILIFTLLLLATDVFAQGRGGGVGSGSNAGDSGGSGYIGQTQSRRKNERFDILSWITENKKIVAAQNAKMSSSKGGAWFTPDLTLQYYTGSGDISREGVKFGNLTETTTRGQLFLDDFFSAGNQSRSINIDVGAEYYQTMAEKFKVDPTSTQLDYQYNEQGGALLLRPFGRSSQDTGLFVKGGYLDRVERGHFFNNLIDYHIRGTYLGAEAKLYLLPFLGAQAEYQALLETTVDELSGKVKFSKLQYSGFLEIFLLQLKAYMTTYEHYYTPNSGSQSTKEVWNVVGVSGSLHF